MFAAKRLLGGVLVALCCSVAAASAQTVNSAPVSVTPLPNAVTPSPTISGPTPSPARANDPRRDETSPLLDPETPWSPRTPRLPNASPDEPPLIAPLLPIDQP